MDGNTMDRKAGVLYLSVVELNCCEKQPKLWLYKSYIIYCVLLQNTQVESKWFKKLCGSVREIGSSYSPGPSVSYRFSKEFYMLMLKCPP